MEFWRGTGDLLVVSYAGKATVYSFKPESLDESITVLQAQPSARRHGMTPVLPVDYWRNENDFTQAIVAPRLFQFVSPDNSVFIPVKPDFINNDLYYGIKMHDVIGAFGLAPAVPGKAFYVSDESEEKLTPSVSVKTDLSPIQNFLPSRAGKEWQSMRKEMFISPQARCLYIALPAH